MSDDPRTTLETYAAIERDYGRECGRMSHGETSPQAIDALHAVLTVHSPVPIYGECGHHHDEGEYGVIDIDPVGLTCDDGYMYTICCECCTHADEQVEVCADHHDNRYCWPCRTVRALTEEVGGDDAK